MIVVVVVLALVLVSPWPSMRRQRASLYSSSVGGLSRRARLDLLLFAHDSRWWHSTLSSCNNVAPEIGASKAI